MRHLYLLIVMGVFCSACATTMLYHPDYTEAKYNHDMYECETLMHQRLADMGAAGNVFMMKGEIQKCMVNKFGWTTEP